MDQNKNQSIDLTKITSDVSHLTLKTSFKTDDNENKIDDPYIERSRHGTFGIKHGTIINRNIELFRPVVDKNSTTVTEKNETNKIKPLNYEIRDRRKTIGAGPGFGFNALNVKRYINQYNQNDNQIIKNKNTTGYNRSISVSTTLCPTRGYNISKTNSHISYNSIDTSKEQTVCTRKSSVSKVGVKAVVEHINEHQTNTINVENLGIENDDDDNPENNIYQTITISKPIHATESNPNCSLGFSLYKEPCQDENLFVIKLVENDSSAFIAGLKIGDRILSIDGQHFNQFSMIEKYLEMKNRGDKIILEIKRARFQMSSIIHEPSTTNHKRKIHVIKIIMDNFSSLGIDLKFFEEEKLRKSDLVPETYIYDDEDECQDNFVDYPLEGLYVQNIRENTACYGNPNIKIHDQLVSINGINLTSLHHSEAMQIVKKVILEVRHSEETSVRGKIFLGLSRFETLDQMYHKNLQFTSTSVCKTTTFGGTNSRNTWDSSRQILNIQTQRHSIDTANTINTNQRNLNSIRATKSFCPQNHLTDLTSMDIDNLTQNRNRSCSVHLMDNQHNQGLRESQGNVADHVSNQLILSAEASTSENSDNLRETLFKKMIKKKKKGKKK